MINAFEKILEMLEEEREYSYADFTEYVNEYSPCLDSEYDDFFHRGLERASRLVKEVAEEYKNGHFGCNFNGEHEKCKDCCLTDCKNRNTIWFGLDVTDTNVGNNGWVPCSERLPEESYGCLVTIMDCEPSTQTEFENILPYFAGYDGESWNDAEGKEIPFEVIAWQPIPKPYKESEDIE